MQMWCLAVYMLLCSLSVADLIVGMEELELHHRCRGRCNLRKIKIATISIWMVDIILEETQVLSSTHAVVAVPAAIAECVVSSVLLGDLEALVLRSITMKPCGKSLSENLPLGQGFPKGGFCGGGGEISVIGVVRTTVAIINFASNPCENLWVYIGFTKEAPEKKKKQAKLIIATGAHTHPNYHWGQNDDLPNLCLQTNYLGTSMCFMCTEEKF